MYVYVKKHLMQMLHLIHIQKYSSKHVDADLALKTFVYIVKCFNFC